MLYQTQTRKNKRRQSTARAFLPILSLSGKGLIFFFMGFISATVFREYIPQVGEPAIPLTDNSLSVCFSPEGQCESLIISQITKAKSSLYVQCYSFTSKTIAKALVEAKDRGVMVKVLTDKSQLTDKHSQISWLKKQGVPIFVDEITGIAHNKVMIIDEKTVLTGSYNWSKAANARNAENLLVLDSPEVAQTYLNNWKWRSSIR